MTNKLTSRSVIKRYAGNPVLSASNVPYPSELTFNAGVVKYKEKYVMIFRNEYRKKDPNATWPDVQTLGLAFSDDGINWDVQKNYSHKWDRGENTIISDFRFTVIDEKCIATFTAYTEHGICGVIAETEDFCHFKTLNMTVPNNRNMVLFPKKINGRYIRFERPFPAIGVNGEELGDIWISYSPDLKHWGDSEVFMTEKDVPFANDKMGAGPPPIKTPKGWLTIFHAVDDDPARGKNGWEDKWTKRYTAGVMLLDLNDPRKIIGMHKEPLMTPEASYEISNGLRNNVIFPGGIILEETGEVKIYYGAADTVECLATANLTELIELCMNQ
jgi:beta-1,4-mannooligosaccharide/beta-1,4-mannosyl-N-acetylglucosamine phosphorylase